MNPGAVFEYVRTLSSRDFIENQNRIVVNKFVAMTTVGETARPPSINGHKGAHT